jgi:hypothetical protein
MWCGVRAITVASAPSMRHVSSEGPPLIEQRFSPHISEPGGERYVRADRRRTICGLEP